MGKRNKTLVFTIILSIFFHIGLFLLLDMGILQFFNKKTEKKLPPQEVTVVFPENKPKPQPRQIVENINENEEIPDKSDYLSDKNSRARNPEKTEKILDNPNIRGNSPIADLSPTRQKRNFKKFSPKKFSSKVLRGESSDTPKDYTDNEKRAFRSENQNGSNRIFSQTEFSVEELGAISLSTYAWEWAPYIHKLKKKLYRVWVTPPAYNRLGIIYGQTLIKFTINKNGDIIQFAILRHDGHPSLEVSSSSAIKALFPFLPLPENFPDENLTITARLIYPNLKQER